MDTELINKIKLVGITYDIKGRLVNIGKIYGYRGYNGRLRVIDTVKMEPFTDEYFRIDYLDDDIAVLGHTNNYLKHISIMINLYTFEVMYTTSKYLFNEKDLFIEQPDDIDRNIKKLNIVDKRANILYSFDASDRVVLVSLNNSDLYLLRYEYARENEEDYTHFGDYRYFEILRYKNDKIERLAKSREYDIDGLREGVLLFSKFNDYTETYVYDFNNKCLISNMDI